MSQAGRLGTTQCELIPNFLVKWVSHWNTLHTTPTPQTRQVGVPLEHNAHHPNSTNWTNGCMPHWNTLHTTPTPQTGQVGVPLEHTAHHPNPQNWTSGCPTGIHCTPPQLHKLDKWVSHWNTPHTTQTPKTGQVGVPLEHVARTPPNPHKLVGRCPIGTH